MDSLELMYKVIGVVHQLEYPIVFKGALVLKHITSSNAITNTYRGTKDIDCDWVAGDITMAELEHLIRKAINSLSIPSLSITRVRDAGVGRSASFAIVNNGVKLFTMDVSLKSNDFTSLYKTMEGICFRGASIQKIIVDKMCAVSSESLKRRTKDIYDLYLISFLDDIHINEIIHVGRNSGRVLKDFNYFLYSQDEIKHAYTKMRDVYNKPEFDTMYSRVRDFCLPFIQIQKGKMCRNAVWDVKSGVWCYL